MASEVPPLRNHPIPAAAWDEWLWLSAELEREGPIPCRTGDPESWWPTVGQWSTPRTRAAVDACRGCPAVAACLAYALAADERFGVWGGTLPDQRRALRSMTAAR
jgi:Transcription factor WhiB